MIPCPIAFETLVALWSHELPAEQADAVEAHLFSCDTCAAASERLGQLIAGMRELIFPVMTRAQCAELAARGMQIKVFDIAKPDGNEAFFAPGLDLMVFSLRVDLSGAERVDLELVDEGGTPHVQFLNVPFDVSRGEVLVACQRHYESFDPLLNRGAFRVVAHHAGQRREIGSFMVKHIWR